MSEINYQKLISQVLGSKPVAYNPDLARICSSASAGILLSQLLYWWNKRDDGIEWIYKSHTDIENETAITRRELDAIVPKLVTLGFVEVEVRGVPAKRHFKLNLESVILALHQLHQTVQLAAPKRVNKLHETVQLDPPNGAIIYTESTTENTQRIPESTASLQKSEAPLLKKYSSLKDISEDDLQQIAEKYQTSIGFVKLQLEKMTNYCESKGRRYKNYKAALRNFVVGDMQRNIERRQGDPNKRGVDASNL